MERSFVRVAVVQLAYHPAIVAAMRSPLEDPGGTEALLPASADVPEAVRPKLDELRRRTRATYAEQLLGRVRAILATCRNWKVRLVVFPEYSIPWDILEDVAKAAGDLVVVAGTHMVERAGRSDGLYERLGWPKEARPRVGQAVAPVLHGGALRGLSPKFQPATAVGEDIVPGTTWQSVKMPDGIAGPMGVMVCLDFLHRENELHRTLIGPALPSCRFLAVPSFTRKPSVHEFEEKAWVEAKRYGRPVLYTNHADGGGASIFIDEEKRSGLRPFPERVGCLDPGDEGVIVADVDLGFERPGGSTRYDAVRAVKPVAAASLVYRTHPDGEAYAAWLEAMAPLLERDDDDALDALVERIGEARAMLQRAGRQAGAKARTERLGRLASDLRYVRRVEEIRQLTRDVVMPAWVLPFDWLRAALAQGAQGAAQTWLVDHPELGFLVKRLRETGSLDEDGDWTQAGRAAGSRVASEVLGDDRVDEGDPFVLTPRGLDLIGSKPVAHEGFLLSFRARPESFEFRIPVDVLAAMRPVGEPIRQSRSVAPPETAMDGFAADMDQARIWEVEYRYRMLAAEGADVLVAVGVRMVSIFDKNGKPMPMQRRTEPQPTVFILRAHNDTWIVSARPNDRDWMIEDAAALLAALQFCGFNATSFEFIDDTALLMRRDRLLERFHGARAVLDEFLNGRLAEVTGHFVEPSVAVNGVVQPGPKALDDWLGLGREPSQDHPRAAILLGEYGLGKSTLLAVWAAQLRERAGAPVPLFVNLAIASSKEPAELLLQAAGLEVSRTNREALQLLLAAGCVLPIFDGFDEMATRVGRTELPGRLADLLEIVARGGKVILSSRDHYFPTERELHDAIEGALRDVLRGPRDARQLMIQPFDDAQVRTLVGRVAGEERAEGILVRLRAMHDLNDLVHRPLLLGMVLFALDMLPTEGTVGRLDVYEASVRRWIAQSGGREAEIFTPEQKQDLAEAIAAKLWRSGEPSCSLSSLRQALLRLFPPEICDDVPRMAEVLETTGGMFFVRASGEPGDRYRFAHKSLLEYFFARSLVRALRGGAKDLEDALSTKRLTLEVVGFVHELLVREGDPKVTAAVNATQRWLQRGRRAWQDQDPELGQTAEAAANALRLLLGLSRLASDPGGWIPEEADLRRTDFVGEDLRGAVLVRARFNEAKLSGADLSSADMTGAVLTGACLSSAKLDASVLRGVSARGADMEQVEVSDAVVDDADFAEATLQQSTWTECSWIGARAEGANVTACAILGQDKALGSAVRLAVSPPFAQASLTAGHSGIIYSLAWHPNGKRLASAGADRTVRIWDVPTGKELARLDKHRRWVFAVAWHPDGKLLTSAGDDGKISLWDPATGKELAIIIRIKEAMDADGPSHWISDLAWHPQGKYLAIAGHNAIVYLWDAATRQVVLLKGHAKGVNAVAWHPNGKLLASAGHDKSVRLWDVMSGKEVDRFERHTRAIWALAWHPDGKLLVSAGDDRALWSWDVTTGKELVQSQAHTEEVRAVAWHPDGKLVASAGVDGAVHLWDAIPGKQLARLKGHLRGVSTLTWQPDGKRLASGGRDSTIRQWEPVTGIELVRMDGHAGEINTAAWCPDGKRFATAGGDMTVRLWDAASGKELARLEGHTSGVSAVAWHPQGKRLASAGADSTVRLWDANSGKELARLEGHINGATSIAWHPDGKLLATVGANMAVRIWDAKTGEEVAQLQGHTSGGTAVVWHPDGKRLASAGTDQTVRLLDAETGTELAQLTGHTGLIHALAWHPDGELLASGGQGQTMIVWNTATGKELARVENHMNVGMGLAWSPDGKILASAGYDKTVCLWNTATVRDLILLTGHTDRLMTVAWHPDGTRLISAGLDGTVRLWRASPPAPLATFEIAGTATLTRTLGGFCLFGDGDRARYRLAVRRPESNFGTVLYLPLARLRDVLHRPDKVAAALAGDLSGDDLDAELTRLGWNNGVQWDGEVHFIPAAQPSPAAPPASCSPPSAFAAAPPAPSTPPLTSTVKLPKPLLEAYRATKLALFVGSGLSLSKGVQGNLPTWQQLPERLLDACADHDVLDADNIVAKRARFKKRLRLDDMLAELGALRTVLDRHYQDALNTIFRPADAAPGAVHRAVATLAMPLILTTNYDQLLELEEPRRQPYTWKEADRALGDLRRGSKVLLKVHGMAERHETVVMTEREYHEVRADVSYRAVLGYLLQTYSFLFVGYGMNDPLDLDLVLRWNADAFKTSAQQHFALLKDPSGADQELYQRDYHVRVIPYADHAELPLILASLVAAASSG